MKTHPVLTRPILPKAARAVAKGFPKASKSHLHVKEFQKASGVFVQSPETPFFMTSMVSETLVL
jgi:hypothetical protein